MQEAARVGEVELLRAQLEAMTTALEERGRGLEAWEGETLLLYGVVIAVSLLSHWNCRVLFRSVAAATLFGMALRLVSY
jgi:hypothetical protein